MASILRRCGTSVLLAAAVLIPVGAAAHLGLPAKATTNHGRTVALPDTSWGDEYKPKPVLN
ncbi:hypothetical protein OG500_29610 [Kitasatospora sp. NBC_01250]|uniref:hypothetical protein n=1 Tax=unclassified Kitasatospora TaxID=2633591 RepID=UPI002E0E9CC0|nr:MULTISPECIES: hypothetical protein [unclassified Kitasatospora]WSJ70207.1 hypothetical protein OG294_31175 [Kitasatospora sp. NBC_01302]